jgi:ribosomal protein S20
MKLLNRTFSRRTAAKNILSAGTAGLLGASLAEAAPQPHMQAALKALQNASSQLESAADDKAGHRAKAIQLVSQAINQVQQGIQAGK